MVGAFAILLFFSLALPAWSQEQFVELVPTVKLESAGTVSTETVAVSSEPDDADANAQDSAGSNKSSASAESGLFAPLPDALVYG